ncbi:hypothetical protein [Chitiniphilus eburneus]|uniref:Uncharacterized protein n=1 Tax=Chitiniphilus eburneus TaxID=2571148 RepID=A0A4U0PF14_9NEIS|nr:hypothetical protein [Chitiniphilus eburneus]TJZ65632.1 hypothetical protein FAZ21_18025 [Chitiniphilus eburneus]
MRHVVVLLALSLGPGMPVHAELVEQIAHMRAVIEMRCGPRINVLWVDEAGVAPPCQHSYSPGCEEIQGGAPNLCIAPDSEQSGETAQF